VSFLYPDASLLMLRVSLIDEVRLRIGLVYGRTHSSHSWV